MQNSKYLQNISHSQVLELVEKEDIEALIGVLKTNSNAAVLKHAILFLGGHKVKKTVDPLILLLQSEYESVRQCSVLALGQIGDKKAIKPLSLLLNQEKEKEFVRKEALRSLVVLDGEEGKESIYQILSSEWSGPALTVLKEMGKPSVKYLTDALLQAQQNGDQALVGEIIRILGEIGECAKPATATLLAILKTISNEDDWDCSRRQAVLVSLALIKDPDAVEPLIGFINYNTTYGDGDYTFQNWIIFALGDIGDKQATEALIRIMLSNDESRVKGTAAAALGKIGDNKAVQPLLTVLENEKEDEFVRENAAWALLQLDENKSALPVMRYLKHNYHDKFNFLKGVSFPSEFQNDAYQP